MTHSGLPPLDPGLGQLLTACLPPQGTYNVVTTMHVNFTEPYRTCLSTAEAHLASISRSIVDVVTCTILLSQALLAIV